MNNGNNSIGAVTINPGRTDGTNAVEGQYRAAAFKRLPLAVGGLFPDEPVHGDGKTPVPRQVNQIADLEHGVLDMGGDDGEILLVESAQFQGSGNIVHGRGPR